MKITVIMKSGEKSGENYKISDLFPNYNSKLAAAVDRIEIESELFTIRVGTTFLLETEAGKWFCSVLTKNGTWSSWNGTIYAGGVVYLDGKKAIIGNNRPKYEAIVGCRDELKNTWRNEK